MRTRLIDDGHRVYRALNEFEWNEPVQETPWGPAAYVGEGSPRPMATGRNGGWFGTANGRTWSQIYPVTAHETPEIGFDINSEDIYAVNPEMGGGYVAYGRHDIGPDRSCPFGTLHARRISVGEASRCKIMETVFINKTGRMFDTLRAWYDEYMGDGNFTLKTETLTGTRAELGVPGMDLQMMGWTMENNDTAKFTITRETVSDNNGIFAVRNIPTGRA